MTLSTFTLFCNYNFHPPPALLHLPKLKLCSHSTGTPHSRIPALAPPLPHPDPAIPASTFCLDELDSSKYLT